MADDVECAPLIAKNVAPSAGAHGLPSGVSPPALRANAIDPVPAMVTIPCPSVVAPERAMAAS
jgi:hypothetical protein